MLRQERVHPVNEQGQSECAKDLAKRPSGLKREQEHDASALVARNRRTVAQYQPPAFRSLFLGYMCEKANRFLICKREQAELFTLVEFGDEPRRPATKPSSARIQQNGA